MFTSLTSWIWGTTQVGEDPVESETAVVEHSTQEEAGDWVVITQTRPEENDNKGCC